MRCLLWCGVQFFSSLGTVLGLFFVFLFFVVSVEHGLHSIWPESSQQWIYFVFQFPYFFCLLASFFVVRKMERQGAFLSLILSGYTPLFLSFCFAFWGFVAGLIGYQILNGGLEEWKPSSVSSSWIPWNDGFLDLKRLLFFNGTSLEQIEIHSEYLYCLEEPFWCSTKSLSQEHPILMVERFRRILMVLLSTLVCCMSIWWRRKPYFLLSSALILVLIHIYYAQLV
ncbi:MAG: hypothetical protein VX278_05515 [Myxococcota bacterium]|nr:hypothetical protein [Myxococcota bacterium]